jgi:RHS repeat-associated protein
VVGVHPGVEDRDDYPVTEVDTFYHYDGDNYGTSEPNAIGRLTGTEKSGAVLTYVYDARGNLIRQTTQMVGNSYDTTYQYDADDNVTEIVYPSGRTIGYQRDAMGRVTAVTATHDGEIVTLADQITYLPFGGIESLTLGNGQTVDMSHDLDYRLTGKQVPGLIDLSWNYDTRDNITAITDATGQLADQQFSYGALSRLSQAQGPYGTIDYSYDGVGNRLSRSIGGDTETYAYSPSSHHLESVTDSSGATDYTYDAAGNTLTKGGGERQYSYDPAGRLTEINELGTNAHLGALRYNAHGQRFHATLAQENRREVYHYDQDGRLIAEMDHSGSPVLREYVYLEGEPLAMFARRQASSGGGLLGDLLDPITGLLLPVEVFYFHTDHLGTPRVVADSSGAVVWQGQYRPFGNVSVTTEDVVNPLRFPGQRDDGTSGVYYNYFRDYDPATGRYIQSDPIGLTAGLNTYGYVGGKPSRYIDETGLCPWCLVGAAIGGGLNVYAQYQRNGGFNNFDFSELGFSAATGLLGGGLGTATRGLSFGRNVLANTVGSGGIGVGITTVENKLTGQCQDVVNAGLISAALGGAGSAVGNVFATSGRALNRYLANRWWEQATLQERLWATSNAITWDSSPPFWTTAGVVSGNISSNVISNANQ